MKYFKLFMFSLVLIIPLIFGFKAGTVLAVGDYSPGSIDLNISPSNATTSIKISGNIDGGESDEGLCGSGRCENFVVYQVAQVQYQIDNGSWVSLIERSDWWQTTVLGSNTDCSTCAAEHVYEYKYTKDIDVSGLRGGIHTVTVQARDNYGTWSASGDFTKPNVDLKVNDSNGPIAIPSGSSAALTWTSSHLGSNPSCVASGSWSGDRPTTGFESTGILTTPQTYTLTCSGGDGSASDTVRVNISNAEQGVVAVRATLDGVSWSGDVSYTLNGPQTISGTAAPTDHYNVPVGTYTLSVTSGGPTNSSLISITPASSLLVFQNQTTTFTLNFQTLTPTPPAEHKACNSSRQCVTVSGSGPDQCINNTSCNLPPQGFVCNFTWSPESPKTKTATDFLDYTQTEEGTTLRSWQWTFEDATPQTSTNQNPTGVIFNSIGEKTVTLRVTNSSSETCTLSQEVTVQSLSPKWIEVVPK